MSIPQKYDAEFKTNAVRLALSSNKSHREIADDLGVGQSTLNKWVRNYRLGRTNNLSTISSLSSQEQALKTALKELNIVKQERDILKKALGIFSLPEKI